MRIILITILIFLVNPVYSQIKDSSKLFTIKHKLELISKTDTLFNSRVDISSSKLPLSEVVKTIASISGVNISIQGAESKIISCNFKRARVSDIIYFLCKEYSYDIDNIGNIVSIFPYFPPMKEASKPNVKFNSKDSTLYIDIANSRLVDVVKVISSEAKVNIIIPQQMLNNQISCYFNNLPLHEGIITLMNVNNLDVQQTSKKTYNIISLSDKEQKTTSYKFQKRFSANQINIDVNNQISASITNGNVQDLITDVMERLKLNFHFITPINKQLSIYVNRLDLDKFLNILLLGSSSSWTVKDGIYYFGGYDKEKALVSSMVIRMKNRSVDKIIDYIPAELKSGLNVSTYPDLNSIVVSGDQKGIAEIESFINKLDQRIPLINIDVIIVETTKSLSHEVGLGLGIGDAPAKTKGTLSPGVDFTINATDLDKIINSINGLGPINLGNKVPNLYMNLKMLEQTGNVVLKSTPKLATLNGNEANLKSGETKYYKEVQSSIYGAQNPIESKSYTWKSVEANLNLKIIPFISEDSTITLKIEIEQSEFTPRTDLEAPPGLTTRSFKSTINVNSEDVVLLGGIERNLNDSGSSGLPLISRIPVLKWIFGKSSKNKKDYKLNIFIKPSVIF
ncbi:hypothetical protein SDC9_47248 [bioreactor metagenome]|uniref:Secretin/TonB short N-terminal domain-containing protein n=1 Tax=bioreactor metagenome TaxID=1076179 RepID=A0A644WC10_9ZZZZ